ncbi:hypothetical protein TRIATDRAFT_85327 [Trichoderma atroviride IMI 206040]|uniref:Uncharacterized protein n=1 Tax=Hypocrea atroviridis (strain ATCC 20476 / IMI 206040) TaxID=452589 RepID=G9P7S0_HYPAI|nr:uncharacterized protein TRIATDRAFT_85327 [Trichoderma atroviride IMI 206040]EHK40823.1 hypothetical protein TRIATDRAFT_85327 [Trichoderma atroviride IMI 206040]
MPRAPLFLLPAASCSAVHLESSQSGTSTAGEWMAAQPSVSCWPRPRLHVNGAGRGDLTDVYRGSCSHNPPRLRIPRSAAGLSAKRCRPRCSQGEGRWGLGIGPHPDSTERGSRRSVAKPWWRWWCGFRCGLSEAGTLKCRADCGEIVITKPEQRERREFEANVTYKENIVEVKRPKICICTESPCQRYHR